MHLETPDAGQELPSVTCARGVHGAVHMQSIFMGETMSFKQVPHWVGCLVAAVALAACTAGPGDTGPVGTIDMSLTISPGVEVDLVTYEITGNGITPITGDIPVDAFGSTISAQIGGIPAGMGYLITLMATSVDGATQCVGSSTFDVVANDIANVTVSLLCGGADDFGSVIVNGEINLCPVISSYAVAPLQTSVGNSILLHGQGTDADSASVELMWSATGGTIADPTANDTTYTCQVVGTQTITLTVTDTATDLGADVCGDTQDITVQCVAGQSCDTTNCDDGNPCTADSCVEDPEVTCVNDPLPDGTDCTTAGGVAGTCMGNVCTPPGFCETANCDDGNECTTDTCDPDAEACVNTPDTGAACTLTGGGAGVCDATGTCVEPSFCVPGVCDDGNECTVDTCDEDLNTCTNTPDVGATCTTGDGGSGTCDDTGACVAGPEDPAPITKEIPVVCANSFTPDLSQVPVELTVDPGPIVGGMMFDADISATAGLTQEFLQSAAEQVCGFGILLDQVTVNLLQVTATAESGATGGDVLIALSPVPQMVNVPLEGTVTCPGGMPVVTGPLSIDLGTESGTFTADASGDVVFGVAGMIPDTLTLSTPATPTHILVQVSVLGVAFACEPGTLNDNGTPDDPSDDTIDPLTPADLISFPIQ